MVSLTMKCEVSPERTVTLKLPSHIKPGQYEVVVVINAEPESPSTGQSQVERLMRFAGTARLDDQDPVEYQRQLRAEWP